MIRIKLLNSQIEILKIFLCNFMSIISIFQLYQSLCKQYAKLKTMLPEKLTNNLKASKNILKKYYYFF